ncbi:hypothetical protein [Kosakonia sp. S42]|uniref:hypothetical protein n=1 Tax=Kosakonia sp. S42 TaxID=2767458 RepID=UPI00190DBBB5|nr:hypothetical protein [Kosakonia sp. S42]MBK0019136.1 hypothetical protein [Kosakonia sp. S42]
MKISKIVAFSLTMASTPALAFQAKDIGSDLSGKRLRATEDSIISNFYSQHSRQFQTTTLGTCAAVAVPGCNCPFCSMLRSQKL